ncbi:MAG: OmpA family protein [Polyangiaceae bacterium]|nr:OmpA family protein [Polyangiaceae bacterium]
MRFRLHVVSPCSEAWDSFREDAPGRRHCGSCDRTVVDLTSMTEREAMRLALTEKSGLCGRVLADERGVAVFEQRASGRRLGRASAVAALALGAAACATSADTPPAFAPPSPSVAVQPPAQAVADATWSGYEEPPFADQDEDGLRDEADECPDKPGPLPKGCPIVVVTLGGMAMGPLEQVQFAAGSARVPKDSEKMLDEVVAILIDEPAVILEVRGHSQGEAKGLGMARANAVKQYLVKAGIDEARLLTRDIGDAEPIDDPRKPARNRRVDFRIAPAPADPTAPGSTI